MTIELTTTDKRDLDALVYFLNADKWQRRITLRNGQKVYGIPSRSRSGLYHLTDGSSCTCEDEKNHQPQGGCAHRRAAVLYRMERAAELSKKKMATTRYATLLGADDDKPYCFACRRHHTTNMHYAVKAAS